MDESEEARKLIELTYKNLVDNFAPGARQLVSAGKTYLKSLQAAQNAGKVFFESLLQMGRLAEQTAWAGAADIGTTLIHACEVQKDIEERHQQMLKTLHDDLLTPLEQNVEKDLKIMSTNKKKFSGQLKNFQDSYFKRAAAVKKQKKKDRYSSVTSEKEFKQLHTLEEQRTNLNNFCKHHLKQVILQERRRYGFILDRWCSVSSEELVWYKKGQTLQHHTEDWQAVAATRDVLPRHLLKQLSYSSIGDNMFGEKLDPVRRRSRLESIGELNKLSKARSDFNIVSSISTLDLGPQRPKSLDMEDEEPIFVRARYSFLGTGDHQLVFHEGDVLELIGDKNSGWHFGTNLRTNLCGWFPISYTEPCVFKTDTTRNQSEEYSLLHNSLGSTSFNGSSSDSGYYPPKKNWSMASLYENNSSPA